MRYALTATIVIDDGARGEGKDGYAEVSLRQFVSRVLNDAEQRQHLNRRMPLGVQIESVSVMASARMDA